MHPYYELGCSFDKEDMKKDSRCEFVPRFHKRITHALMVIHNKKFFECMKKYKGKTDKDSIKWYAWHKKYIYFDENEFMEKYEDLELVGDQWGVYTNPNDFWDWYRIGGRWTRQIKAIKGFSKELSYEWKGYQGEIPKGFDIAQVKDITNLGELIPHTLITKKGVLKKENWDPIENTFIKTDNFEEKILEVFKDIDPEAYVTIIDYHS